MIVDEFTTLTKRERIARRVFYGIMGFLFLGIIVLNIIIDVGNRVDKAIQDTKNEYEQDNPLCVWVCISLNDSSITNVQGCSGTLEIAGYSSCGMFRGNVAGGLK